MHAPVPRVKRAESSLSVSKCGSFPTVPVYTQCRKDVCAHPVGYLLPVPLPSLRISLSWSLTFAYLLLGPLLPATKWSPCSFWFVNLKESCSVGRDAYPPYAWRNRKCSKLNGMNKNRFLEWQVFAIQNHRRNICLLLLTCYSFCLNNGKQIRKKCFNFFLTHKDILFSIIIFLYKNFFHYLKYSSPFVRLNYFYICNKF